MMKPQRGMYVTVVFGMLFALCSSMAFATGDTGQHANSEAPEVEAMTIEHKGLPERKQTTLGLYVTASEAYAKWQTAPETIKILDVRAPEEYIFVGHAEMALNIPMGFVTRKWDTDTNQPILVPNVAFVSAVQQAYKSEDVILIICRSGDRSAQAVDVLAKNGFTNAYTITDGMEGDMVNDLDSLFHGKRMKNGWKNSGLPWTYINIPELVWIEE